MAHDFGRLIYMQHHRHTLMFFSIQHSNDNNSVHLVSRWLIIVEIRLGLVRSRSRVHATTTPTQLGRTYLNAWNNVKNNPIKRRLAINFNYIHSWNNHFSSCQDLARATYNSTYSGYSVTSYCAWEKLISKKNVKGVKRKECLVIPSGWNNSQLIHQL